MPEFARLPDVLSAEEGRALLARLRAIRDDMSAEKITATTETLIDVATQMTKSHTALLTRLRLAELAVYRASRLADDMQAEIEAGKKRRSGPPSPEGIAGMAKAYVRDYVEVILPSLREATGYSDGAEREGWYLAAEDTRAKLLGDRRANERLTREGRDT